VRIYQPPPMEDRPYLHPPPEDYPNLEVFAEVPRRQQPAQFDAAVDAELMQDGLYMRFDRRLGDIQFRRDLARGLAFANMGRDLPLAWRQLLPAGQHPGLAVLFLNHLSENLRSDIIRRALLAVCDPLQIIKGLNVHREDAFFAEPVSNVAPDELPSIHRFIL
jgi:hypothetical protein